MFVGVAFASHRSHRVDDSCSVNDTTYFTAAGPDTTMYIHRQADKAFNNCHVYTSTIGSTSDVVNSMSWYLPVSSAYDGDYYVYAFIPCENISGHWNTTDARYRRYRNGSSRGITELYQYNMKAGIDYCTNQGWSSFQKRITEINGPPSYDHFYGSQGGYMMLIDKSSDAGKYVSADMLDYTPRSH
ncbi:MAG: hypothetical protein ABR575_08770 [Actinomycetota bacterium]